ncbi:MAG TPA: N-acetylmuramoyl-L-alanine amidase [Chloroflexia bacterium]|nr:N-acetylmuramoyl-L-alanine amidase [Chloroflexia bacterium]
MKVVNNRLVRDNGNPFTFKPTPNMGGNLQAKYLIMHYTAGRSAAESIGWLTNPAAQASAHLVIARSGAITQLVPFDKVAWHAGASKWKGLVGMNNHSIGIELDNAGALSREGDHWRAWFGGNFSQNDVLEAAHKHGGPVRGWHTFTPEQIAVALEVAMVLKAQYNLRDVVGHDDIAPIRKIDPGPAFPMGSFQARFLGRIDDVPEQMETTADQLNIRSGPGTQHNPIPGSPLPQGTRVEVIRVEGTWSLVDVVGTVNGVNDMEGWVASRFLEPA